MGIRSGSNTILMNVYKDGEDCIGYHRDRETGWAPGAGFATLCFSIRELAHRFNEINNYLCTRILCLPSNASWIVQYENRSMMLRTHLIRPFAHVVRILNRIDHLVHHHAARSRIDWKAKDAARAAPAVYMHAYGEAGSGDLHGVHIRSNLKKQRSICHTVSLFGATQTFPIDQH